MSLGSSIGYVIPMGSSTEQPEKWCGMLYVGKWRKSPCGKLRQTICQNRSKISYIIHRYLTYN